MESFKFKARRQNGEIVTGTITAADEAAVASYVRNKGLIVTAIVKENGPGRKEYFWEAAYRKFFSKSVSLYDIAIFCRQFATLVGAGVTLITALDILVDQTENKKLKEVIANVENEVHQGKALSAAMNQFPKVFPNLMVHMIQAGETGGMLESVLRRLSDQYEKDYRLNARLKSAMVYPGVVIGLSIIVVIIILTFVMPTFVTLFSSLKTELPWPTQVVIGASNLIQHHWIEILVVIAALYYGYKFLEKNKDFCLWRDGIYLKLPVFGDLYKKVIISRFSATFAGLSRSGVPILTALSVVSRATGSIQAERVLNAARNSVQKGKGLSEPMEKSGLFPPMVINMVQTGEETGNLDYMLDKITEFYTAEVDDTLSRLQALLDPFLIVILGVVVGFIAIAMLMPMFDIITKVGNM